MDDAVSDDFKTTNIAAKTGQNVTLLCEIEDKTHMWKWVKAKEKEVVFFFRDGHVQSEGQHPAYLNRVFSLMNATLGDVILTNVMTNDTGTYECRGFVNETRSWKPINIINLRVVDPPAQTGGSIGPIVATIVCAVLLVAAVGGFCIYRRRQPRGERNHDLAEQL
ncbi:V-set and immunoglobulin domain-containing protein 1-like [Neolamprologus brichardi]|uniref:V-set and immunoglobulin domain-containing protein 1-like n=1 Tax=Neolamprologus brichardi TaxID=32507 RepID=UPI0003EC2F77|nr:V-set and immunoglobulin domain-containing protein 1-like [Neolamprologus brichardi]